MTAELPQRVRTERCVDGRLSRAYPVHAHDVEVRVVEELPTAGLTAALRDAVQAITSQDLNCRRVVFAAAEDDVSQIAAAEDAGFRFVVTVDLPDTTVSLCVAEPAWVTSVDMDLEHVPGS